MSGRDGEENGGASVASAVAATPMPNSKRPRSRPRKALVPLPQQTARFVSNARKKAVGISLMKSQTLKVNNKALAKALQRSREDVRVLRERLLDRDAQLQQLRAQLARLPNLDNMKDAFEEEVRECVKMELCEAMAEVDGHLREAVGFLLQNVSAIERAQNVARRHIPAAPPPVDLPQPPPPPPPPSQIPSNALLRCRSLMAARRSMAPPNVAKRSAPPIDLSTLFEASGSEDATAGTSANESGRLLPLADDHLNAVLTEDCSLSDGGSPVERTSAVQSALRRIRRASEFLGVAVVASPTEVSSAHPTAASTPVEQPPQPAPAVASPRLTPACHVNVAAPVDAAEPAPVDSTPAHQVDDVTQVIRPLAPNPPMPDAAVVSDSAPVSLLVAGPSRQRPTAPPVTRVAVDAPTAVRPENLIPVSFRDRRGTFVIRPSHPTALRADSGVVPRSPIVPRTSALVAEAALSAVAPPASASPLTSSDEHEETAPPSPPPPAAACRATAPLVAQSPPANDVPPAAAVDNRPASAAAGCSLEQAAPRSVTPVEGNRKVAAGKTNSRSKQKKRTPSSAHSTPADAPAAEAGARRSRRAAAAIASFKEPPLNTKMRRKE